MGSSIHKIDRQKKGWLRNSSLLESLVMIGMICIPLMLINCTVTAPRDKVSLVHAQSPYGYTISLLIFLLPLIVLTGVLSKSGLKFDRNAALKTILILPCIGYILDLFIGSLFFSFDNSGATCGGWLPAYDWQQHCHRDKFVPVEDLVFYISGVAFTLLVYIWADLVWLRRYHIPDGWVKASPETQVVNRDWRILAGAGGLVLLAYLWKKLGPHPYHQGFPGYFTFIVVSLWVPCVAMFEGTNRFLNWRAFNLTMLVILLVSIIWEVTLGYPYAWWTYHMDQMMGLTIKPWSNLPIESCILWILDTFVVVLFYEACRVSRLLKVSTRPAIVRRIAPVRVNDFNYHERT